MYVICNISEMQLQDWVPETRVLEVLWRILKLNKHLILHYFQIFGIFDHFSKWSVRQRCYDILKNHPIWQTFVQKMKKTLVQFSLKIFLADSCWYPNIRFQIPYPSLYVIYMHWQSSQLLELCSTSVFLILKYHPRNKRSGGSFSDIF